MRAELYGLIFDTPAITFYLWSPWRASMLEHRLFEAIGHLPNVEIEQEGDEFRVHIDDGKTWRTALQNIERIMKGWQEEAGSGEERRTWYWLIDGDTDAHGYDHAGERACLWAGIRICLDRSNPGESDKREDLDMESFGLQIWREDEKPTRRQ
ncbi:MAG TPA: hypothetical protein VKS79_21840 [Gemmataceae bacterium]|nr:hypothetical protein [Gemmataceae bacterium]